MLLNEIKGLTFAFAKQRSSEAVDSLNNHIYVNFALNHDKLPFLVTDNFTIGV